MLMAALFAALAAWSRRCCWASRRTPACMAVHLWLALVGTLGSWAILVPAKFAEGKLEDQVPMRITLLLLGGLVGVAAWFLSDALMSTSRAAASRSTSNRGMISHEMLVGACRQTA